MAKPQNKLTVRWSKHERDLMFNAPRKIDGMLAHAVLCCERMHLDARAAGLPVGFDKSFVAELEARGYDITTLRFSVERKPQVDR